MSDIVERLRAENSVRLACGLDLSDVLLDAANEIERLRAVLRDIARQPEGDEETAQAVARAALAKEFAND